MPERIPGVDQRMTRAELIERMDVNPWHSLGPTMPDMGKRNPHMKALTVQQPWAWAIIHGGKTIENRTQMWSYRGPLAIHAGLRWSDRGAESPLVCSAWHAASGPLLEDMHMGVILGVVDLIDCHPDAGCCKPWGESSYVEHGGRERRRIIHLVLENARPLAEPIPCTGRLGLWTPPADITKQLQAVTSA